MTRTSSCSAGETVLLDVDLAGGRCRSTFVLDVIDVAGSAVRGVNEWGDQVQFDIVTGVVSVDNGVGTLTGVAAVSAAPAGTTAAKERRWLADRAYWRGVQAGAFPVGWRACSSAGRS